MLNKRQSKPRQAKANLIGAAEIVTCDIVQCNAIQNQRMPGNARQCEAMQSNAKTSNVKPLSHFGISRKEPGYGGFLNLPERRACGAKCGGGPENLAIHLNPIITR